MVNTKNDMGWNAKCYHFLLTEPFKISIWKRTLQINKNEISIIAKKFVSQSYVMGYLRLLFTHVDTSKTKEWVKFITLLMDY